MGRGDSRAAGAAVVSNRRYYLRRAAGQCPDCGVAVETGVYCPTHRDQRRQRVQQERVQDRAGYNQYMRVYQQAKKNP